MQGIRVRVQDSLISGVINGVINGAIAWNLFSPKAGVPISLDLISTDEVSVWGQAVSLSFGLGIILSVITAKIFISHLKKALPEPKHALVSLPLFPTLLRIAFNNAAFLFGWFVALAVVWTKLFGVVMVSPLLATVLVGLFALLVTLIVEVKTKNAIIFKKVCVLD